MSNADSERERKSNADGRMNADGRIRMRKQSPKALGGGERECESRMSNADSERERKSKLRVSNADGYC